jgi:hypothetical protein
LTDLRSRLIKLGASMDDDITRVMMMGVFHPAVARAAMEYELLGRRTLALIGAEDERG